MAAELITALDAALPTTTMEKIKHIKAIQDVTAVLAGRQTLEGPTVLTAGTHAPRVCTGTPAPRVAAPRKKVGRVATTSNNITAPNIVIRNMPLVHERQQPFQHPHRQRR